MAGCQEMLENANFSPLFCHFRPNFFFSCRTAYSIFKVVYIRLVLYQKSEKSMDWLPRRVRKRIFFTPFSPFSTQKKFFLQNCHTIFKVVYQASHIPKIRKIYGLVAETCTKKHIFHTFFAIFGPKNLFLQNCLCHI